MNKPEVRIQRDNWPMRRGMMKFEEMLCKTGRRPWAPSPAATDLDVWHSHDIPLIGTFRFDGHVVLFASVDSAEDRISTWGYALADDAPAMFSDLKQMRAYVEAIFRKQESCYAVAADLKTWKWSQVERHDSLLDGALALLRSVTDALEDDAPPEVAVNMRLAEVESVIDELAPA